jgi:hypothetical protein
LGTVNVSDRLNTSAALFVTGPDPSVPTASPAPNCTVPPLIVVPPA